MNAYAGARLRPTPRWKKPITISAPSASSPSPPARLSRKADVIATIRKALGARDVGLFDECREHTPLESVMACLDAVRAANPDLILTVGGGSPIDMVKVIQLCLTQMTCATSTA